MSYFAGIFTTQYHKSRTGYFINHDLLMSVSPAARSKLIFYFIAEHVPEKLDYTDRDAYMNERNSRLGYPIAFWTYASFFALFIPYAITTIKQKRLSMIKNLTIWGIVSGYSATIVNSALWRSYEGRVVESSHVINSLSEKYNFGIYDFALAKKESHVKKLLEVYDSQRKILHEEN